MEETMTKRSPLVVFLLSIVTIGIYLWYWDVKTKGELNARGASIPTAWIWLIPAVGTIYWLFKYSEGVEKVTGGRKSTVTTFLVLWLIAPIGAAILQSTFNEVN
jgi:ACR3 family arsenite efflux pump ArsB